jgi:hypothetical protein
MNLHAKILNKILAIEFNSVSKRSYTMVKLASSQECRNGSKHYYIILYKCNTEC